MVDQTQHWSRIYETRAPETVSWYEASPATSLELIEASGLPRGAVIVDIGGGGASRLAPELIERGYRDVTVVDVAAPALARSREAAGGLAGDIDYVEADVTAGMERPCDLWHDRALFHFMVERAAREAYVDSLRASLRRGGFAVLAGFGPDGPTSCSGLPVVRRSAEDVARACGPGFELVDEREVAHTTPGGNDQQFVYALLRRPGSG
jgi:SAM-dependent methyltransferase